MIEAHHVQALNK